MLNSMSNPPMTSSLSSSSSAVVSNESVGLPLVMYEDAWRPEVTQRVSTLVLLMIVTFVGNVAVVVRLATRRRQRSRDRCSRPSRVDVFILNLAVGDLSVCGFTMTTEVLFVVFEEGWVLGPIACKVLLYVQRSCDRCRRPSRVDVFILNLAVVDLSVCGFTMTTEVLFVVFEEGWVLGPIACKVLLYVQIVTLASTTFILLAMSFDRYWSICRPMGSLPASAQSRSYRMVSIAWLMAFIFASPQLVIFKQVAVGIYPDDVIKYKCASRGYTAWWQRKTYFTFMTSYILVVPAILMTYCYVNVVLVVWKRSRELTGQGLSARRDEAASGQPTDYTASPGSTADGLLPTSVNTSLKTSKLRRSPLYFSDLKVSRQSPGGASVQLRRSVNDSRSLYRARSRTVQLTLCIVCLFIACWTPYFVVHLIHIWTEYRHKIPERVYVSAETLALVNSAVNPVLYGFFNNRLCRRKAKRQSGVGRRSFLRSDATLSATSRRHPHEQMIGRRVRSSDSASDRRRSRYGEPDAAADCNIAADDVDRCSTRGTVCHLKFTSCESGYNRSDREDSRSDCDPRYN